MSRIADASMMNDLALAPIIDMAIAEPEVGPSNDLPCDPLSQSDDDWDRDGLSDREEQMEGTSVCHADSDNDGVIDLAEVRYHSDPWDPNDTVDHYFEVPADPGDRSRCRAQLEITAG